MRAFHVGFDATLAALVLTGMVFNASTIPHRHGPPQSPVTTASGLQMIDTKVGTGASPRTNQTAACITTAGSM